MEPALKFFGNRTPEFWTLLGPFFASKQIRKEMPYLSDDTSYGWFVSEKNGKVRGFVAVDLSKPTVATVHCLYVTAEERMQGLGSEMIRRAVQYASESGRSEIKATTSPASRTVFSECGFREDGMRGTYTLMSRGL